MDRSLARILLLALLSPFAVASSAVAQRVEDAPEDAETRAEILLARRQDKLDELTPYEVPKWEARLRALEEARFPENIFVKGFRGFRPVIGGMPTGSGFVLGGGYIHGIDSELLQVTANARVSTKAYTSFDLGAEFPTALSDLPFRAFLSAQVRDLRSLRFFGLGPDADDEQRATYQLQDRSFGGGIRFVPNRNIELASRAGLMNVEIGPGSESPSLERLFDPAVIPGFGRDTDFAVYGGDLVVHLLDQGLPPAGLTLRVTGERYENDDINDFDFVRFVGDVQAQIPLGIRSRRLAVRFRTSHSSADEGGSVPFFLMETLGGAKSLRGFREYRFRDTRNVLLNVEYRWEVWNYLDFALFWDGGKVFSDADDFGLSGLETGYGFGIRAFSPGGMTFRIDLARSQEGFRLHIGGGPAF